MFFSRRSFLKRATGAAAAGFAGVRHAGLDASPYSWPIGCQTFPYGKLIDQDFPGTMKMLAAAGIQSIELCSPWYSEHNFGFGSLNRISAAEFKRVIGDAGLTCISSHVDMTECRDKLPWLIDWARERGLTQILVPSLDGPRNPTLDQVKKLADEYNSFAAVSAKSGLQQGLHHEGFENGLVEGRRVFDVLFDLLDPKLVKFQFQMSTVSSGMIADEYFTKHPGRFISMHLQDVDLSAAAAPAAAPAPGARAGGAGAGRGGVRKPIGQGSIDWVKTFRAAKIGGVQNYFIEMSEELMKASVPFLRQLTI